MHPEARRRMLRKGDIRCAIATQIHEEGHVPSLHALVTLVESLPLGYGAQEIRVQIRIMRKYGDIVWSTSLGWSLGGDGDG